MRLTLENNVIGNLMEHYFQNNNDFFLVNLICKKLFLDNNIIYGKKKFSQVVGNQYSYLLTFHKDVYYASSRGQMDFSLAVAYFLVCSVP